jgi:PAS domain S-box-containing protein
LSRARDELDAKVNKRTSELTESNQQLRREITERQRAEEELKKYGVLLTNVRDIVYFVHLDGSIIEVNDAAVKAYGYSRDELKSMNIADLRIPDERAGLSDLLARCYEKGCLLQTTHQRRDGSTFPVEISSRGIELYGQRALIGIGRDITERKRAEEAMKEAKQQAELYVDLMGHDINNLNHSAMGYLELALQTLETEKRLTLDDKEYIERPMQALTNSSALINNVMKLQRLMTEGVKTRPTDLNAIFRVLETISFHSEGRDVLINIPHVPDFMVNANELLKDVFVNLITNAVKHTDIEKTLTVNVKVEPVNENGRKYYRCSVEDNGPGIPDELKKRLFTRFQRGVTGAGGKGLGLYLVKSLVESFGGMVWAEERVSGEPGKGSRFVVLLPPA